MLCHRALLAPVLIVALARGYATAQATPIDTSHSTLTVNVFKSGLFSAFGDDHVVRAPIARGAISQQPPSVSLSVETARMQVLDPKVSAEERAKVQKQMLSESVLAPQKFPEIAFSSTTVEARGQGKWLVRGNLVLHGVSRLLSFDVVEANGHFTGRTKLKQTQFGIEPPGVPGGFVKAKDEVEIVWDIVPVH